MLQHKKFQRRTRRLGYANGFKPRILVDACQHAYTRGYHDDNGRPFYPKALERGVRIETAVMLAVAEMYAQGVSTRKATAVVQELGGFDIATTHVSRAAAELDE